MFDMLEALLGAFSPAAIVLVAVGGACVWNRFFPLTDPASMDKLIETAVRWERLRSQMKVRH
jgi:hypothetical protein